MKGIILAAGYGTRFLPITNVIPKELLPLRCRPAIDFIVEEFQQSGIRDIIIIISPHKKLIKKFYQPNKILEKHFATTDNKTGAHRTDLSNTKITFVYQRHMRGTGHALLRVAKYIDNQAVVVAYPDDLHSGDIPLTKQLIDFWKIKRKSVLAALENPQNPERYGMLQCTERDNSVQDIVEKPPLNAIPSRYASIGRFLLEPQFFTYLQEGWRDAARHKQKEYYHIYALKKLMQIDGVCFHRIQGDRLDIGEPAGYYAAIAYYQERLATARD